MERRVRVGLREGAAGQAVGRSLSSVGRRSLRRVVLAALLLTACDKVPITDINAGFTLAEATWFEEEQTLFVFYRLEAQQGLGPESQVELSYLTDEVELPWTPIAELTPVHTHVPVDCGENGRCGSISLHVPIVPRDVRVRLRYHRTGEMMLDAPLLYHVIGRGPAWSHRSLIVYGVFDETNTRVQWRARHQFPSLRNEEVQALGLRRFVRVSDPRHGPLGLGSFDNPYGYASAPDCPLLHAPLGWEPVETMERARFDAHALPLTASTSEGVCASSMVTDALGTLQAVALARKNPEVRPAFPMLRSPIRSNTPIGFELRPCRRTLSEVHREMQLQRLLLSNRVEICTDDWRSPGFSTTFGARVRSEIEAVRAQGKDMVLVLSFHHDDTTEQLAALVGEALERELAPERDKSSPRVSGAFLFDSYGYELTRPGLARVALWCPAKMEEPPLPDGLPGDDPEETPTPGTAAARSCPLMPDTPDLKLGPFRFTSLPILPTRSQYLRFVEKYSESQAGRMRELSFLAPERTPLSENVELGTYGVATFFNNEVLTAAPTDAFSYCSSESEAPVVFRHELMEEPIPLSALPEAHAQAPQSSYPLGLAWDFPFLLRLKYETRIAGAMTALSFTVPFGIASPEEAYYGTGLWEKGEFSLAETLLQCTRFCDHPTFDSAGVYNVRSPFRTAYGSQCYRPRYPAPATAGGFPLDP